MAIQIKKAVKYGAKLRLALYGPSGSGKTFTALTLATAFAQAEGKRIIVIDTERGSASKYADQFDFDVIDLMSYHPNTYIEAIRAVEKANDYAVLVLDSISHEWEGPQGALELAGRDFTNWAKVTPLHNAFVDAMLRAKMHVIATMRAKEEYVMEKEEGKSKASVRKVGMEPIQRKGIQYEFDVACLMEIDNTLIVEKSRCPALTGQTIVKPNASIASTLRSWLDGEAAPQSPVIVEAGNGHQPQADAPATEQQLASIRKLNQHLGKPEFENAEQIGYLEAKAMIEALSKEYREMREKQPTALKNGDGTPAIVTSPALKVMEVHQRGIERGAWTKDNFYPSASAILGKAVAPENVRALSQADLIELDKAEPVTSGK